MNKPTVTLLTPATAAGHRIDHWLADQWPERSRSEIQRWIKEGLICVDGARAKPSQRLEEGQEVQVAEPSAPQGSPYQAEEISLAITYEDPDLLVIDKPAGMVVHPAPGHTSGTLVNAVLHHCPDLAGVGGERRPGIVHRLDKETSGLIVVAKNDRTHRDLQAQFKARTVYKEYLTLVEGIVEPPQGRINAPIGRHPTDRLRYAVLPPDPATGRVRGRPAVTDYEVLAHYAHPVRDASGVGHFTLVRVVLHTGRTHQIRVHFAWYKHPVAGDALYGYKRQRLALDRHFLHAHRLRFRLPSSQEEREFVAPLPEDLRRVLHTLEQNPSTA